MAGLEAGQYYTRMRPSRSTAAALLATVALASACASPPRPGVGEPVGEASAAVEAPASPFAVLPAVAGHTWKPAWNDVVADAIARDASELLDPGSVPLAEVQTICPGFATTSREGRLAFWTLFLAAISRYESGFDPAARFQEGWKDPETGKPQFSEGLLQLSYSDARYHDGCALDRAAGNIVDPSANLSCGVVILAKQLRVKKTLFPAPRPYYWSVLTNPKVRSKLQSYLAANAPALPGCDRLGM